uniref:Replication protein A 32 kDa subunit-like n=2 Tax=Kryptolebias marmoratus TaxID=37003 RepID=A0A3Q3A193_KRYMA
MCDWELNQVSIVGIIRRFVQSMTSIQYLVDDMTGPPLNVKLWVNMENCGLINFASPGTYVKVLGSLRNYNGQRSLLAMNIRCVKDLNEITSHMLEVVQAHMQLFGKVFDVNMNTTAALPLDGRSHHEGIIPDGLSTIQSEVLNVIQKFSAHEYGISFQDLRTKLNYLSFLDIRTTLAFLINEGFIFPTIDEQHFKSPQQ